MMNRSASSKIYIEGLFFDKTMEPEIPGPTI